MLRLILIIADADSGSIEQARGFLGEFG